MDVSRQQRLMSFCIIVMEKCVLMRLANLVNNFSPGSRFGNAAPLTRRQPREESRSRERTLWSNLGLVLLVRLRLVESSVLDMLLG